MRHVAVLRKSRPGRERGVSAKALRHVQGTMTRPVWLEVRVSGNNDRN